MKTETEDSLTIEVTLGIQPIKLDSTENNLAIFIATLADDSDDL